ncbi:MAG: protein kinase [Anaerolineae bacterium]
MMAPVESLENRQIKGYEVLQMIGMGGFGAVYRAIQPLLGREVAIKVILPEFANSDEFIRRFDAEAQLVARLEHPYIVPLFDYWREPDSAYLVMRYVRGGSLTAHIQRHGAWTLDATMRLLEQIGTALHIAHRNKVVHRDIKPDNILLDGDGNAYLTDFGIARVAGMNEFVEDGITGSLAYMAPEQLLGEEVNTQADIYSLALVLFELLTGEAAYDPSDPDHLITRRLYNVAHNPISFNVALPEAIKAVLFRATFTAVSDRYADVREMIEAFRSAISARSGSSVPAIDLSNISNPYKGLRPFEEADVDDFFGRDALIDQLLKRMQEEVWAGRFLAVVGPSGSGKSSVIKAGLIPALRKGGISGSERWFFVEMVPGASPLDALETAFLSVAQRPPPDFHQQLRTDASALLNASRNVAGELVLFIDQFEELFTLCDHEEERNQFLNLLHRATIATDSRIRVLITLRADYYDRPLLHKSFGALIQARTQVVLPLSAREIEQAIVGPANRVGLIIDPDLIATMIADLSAEPGGLPLLQYALTELFEQRDGLRLTVVAYANIGGVIGVLAKRAEEIYHSLPTHLQPIARQIFLRLVSLSEGQNDARRRVRRSELLSLVQGTNAGQIDKIINAFGRSRLLTFDIDSTTREPMVEIAHEALLRTWTTLQEWLQQNRNNILMERLLANAMREWEQHRHNPDFLLQGGRLDQFEQWSENGDITLTPEEREYLALSLVERQRQDRLDSERREREFRLQRRNRIATRLILIGSLTGVIFMMLLAASALNQRHAAESARATSDANLTLAMNAQENLARQAEESNSVALAANALLLAERDPLLALSLAIEANRFPTPPPFASRALSEIAYAPHTISHLYEGHTAPLYAAVFSPDAKTVLTAAHDNQLILWDAATAKQIRSFHGHTAGINAASFLPDGKRAISVSNDATIRLWNLATGENIATFRDQQVAILSLGISADGSTAITGAQDGTIVIWDLAAGTVRDRLTGHTDGVNAVAISPDGRFALSGGRDGYLILWNLRAGVPLFRLTRETIIGAVAISPDGRTFLSGEYDRTLRLWDTTTGSLLRTFEGHTDLVNSVAYSPDGTRLLSASFDQTIIEWEVSSGRGLHRLSGHVGAVYTVSYSPDGSAAISGGTDLRAISWNLQGLTNGALEKSYDGHSDWVNAVDLSPDGKLLVSASLDGRVIIWDAATQRPLHQFTDQAGEVYAVSFIPVPGQDRHWQVISGGSDGTLMQWDAQTGKLLRLLLGHTGIVNAIAYSADGSRALTASADKTLILWDLQAGKMIRRFSGHTDSVNAVALLPDGKLAISASSDQTLLLWNVATGKPIRKLEAHKGAVWRVVVSPDGQRAYSASTDGTIIEWDLTDGTALRTFVGHTSIIWSLAISKDSRWLASGSDDKTLILWDVSTGKAVRIYRTNTVAFDLKFDLQGTALIAATDDNLITVWRVDSLDQLIRWTYEHRIVRPLTCAERETYNALPLCT